MLAYPGGTYRDRSTSGYQFFHNFFSDLGATVTFSGQPNPIGAALFVVSLVVLVVGMGGILAGLARVYSRSPRALPLIQFAVVAGVFVCACFIGVAATPENRFRSTHVMFTDWRSVRSPLSRSSWASRRVAASGRRRASVSLGSR